MPIRFVVAAGLMFAVLGGLRAQQNTEGVAAIVNGEVITFSDVRRIADEAEKSVVMAGGARDEIIDKIKKVRTEALEALINRQLIISEFKTLGFQFPEKLVDDEIHRVIMGNFNGDRTAFINALQQSGRSMEQYRREQRDNMTVQFMRQRYIAAQTVVSPLKVEQYYQKNAAKFASPGEAKVNLIIVRRGVTLEPRVSFDGTVQQVDPARMLAEEVIAKLDRGEKFADLARKYSDGPGKENGGDLGWLRRDQMRKELADVVFGLQPGKHSGIIDAAEGYYIVMVEGIKKAGARGFAEVRAEAEKMATLEAREAREREWVEQLRKKSYVKVF
jgi:parvulin-like peptidyl-prolyl isomerase